MPATKATGPAHRPSSVGLTIDALRVGFDLDQGVFGRLKGHDVSRFRLGTRRFVGLAHPDLVDQVLHGSRLKYVKSAEYEPIRAGAGTNLLTDEGDSWARHRGVLNPTFARRHLNEIVDLMIDPIESMADARLSGPMRYDIHDDMVALTLRVVANTLFSQEFGPVVDSMNELVGTGMRIAEAFNRLTMVGALTPQGWDRVNRLSRSRLPVPPPLRAFRRIARALDAAVDTVVDERYAHPTEEPDLLNTLIWAEDGTWSRQRVRDEALTFILAGHETTANALSWFWYLLGTNRRWRDRVAAEVDAALGKRRPTADDLGRLPVTTACIQESQRMFSAVPTLARTAVEHDVVGGHHIRAGTTVIVPVHQIHRDPRFWDRPDEFDPRRFLPGAPRPHRSAYLPFGGGRRVCIGQSFALMEMVLVAAVYTQRFSFELAPGHSVEPETSLTLRPKRGVRVNVEVRAGRDRGEAA